MPVPTTAIVLHARSRAEVDGRIGTINNMEELDQFFKKKVAVRCIRLLLLFIYSFIIHSHNRSGPIELSY